MIWNENLFKHKYLINYWSIKSNKQKNNWKSFCVLLHNVSTVEEIWRLVSNTCSLKKRCINSPQLYFDTYINLKQNAHGIAAQYLFEHQSQKRLVVTNSFENSFSQYWNSSNCNEPWKSKFVKLEKGQVSGGGTKGSTRGKFYAERFSRFTAIVIVSTILSYFSSV